ncbi:MAG TPA: hypothetical protein VI488_18120 [Candidatus Angelobacter sp.]
MRLFFARSFSARLRSLTSRLRILDRDLRSNPTLNGAALREFRQAVDHVRMTAWTVSELLNARESQKNPHGVISFLTAERLRRFSQMVRDLCEDVEHDGLNWPVQEVQKVQESLNLLRDRLGLLA